MSNAPSNYSIGNVESDTTIVQGDNNRVTVNYNTYVDLDEAVESAVLRVADRLKLPTPPPPSMSIADTRDPNDPLDAKIREVIKIVEDGSLVAARKAYERLLTTDAPEAPPRSRHRLRANIGQVSLLLGDKQRAISEFKLAYEEDPEMPAAQASLAMSLLLRGEKDLAFEHAKQALEQEKTNLQAACVILDVAPNEMPVGEVRNLIPIELHGKVEILLGLSERASIGGEGKEAEALARMALKMAPNNWQASAALAIALFSPLSALIGIRYTHSLPEELKTPFREGLRLLKQAWAIISERDDAIRGAYVAANLIAALNITDQHEESKKVLARAIEIAPNDPYIIREQVNYCIKTNNWSDVLTWIAKIPSEDRISDDQLALFQARIQTGDAERVLIDTEAFQNTTDDERIIEMIGAIRIDAAAATNKLDAYLKNILEKCPTSILLRSIAISKFKNTDPQIKKILDEIEKLTSQTTDPRELLFAADAYFHCKRFSKSVEIYKKIKGKMNNRQVVYQYLWALHLSDQRAEARALFKELDPNLRLDPEFCRVGIAIYERSGLLKEAIKLLEAVLKIHDNLEDRIFWIHLLDRLGNTSQIKEYLRKVPEDQNGSPRFLILLAQAIDKYVGGTKSLPIAYRALRNGFSDQQVHLGYACGLFLTGNIRHYLKNSPMQAGEDTAVVLTDLDTGTEIYKILETEDQPRIELDEISLSDPFAKNLIGKNVGDEIEISSFPFGLKKFQIKEIHNKYIFACTRTLKKFGNLFPGSQAMISLDVGPNPDTESFQPILDMAKQNYNIGKSVFDVYQERLIPIGMIAKFLAISPLSAITVLLHQDKANIRCCIGNELDLKKAQEAMAQATQTIIDPVTLFTLITLGIAPAIKEICPNLSIVQTSIDMIHQFTNEQERKTSQNGGTLGWDGVQFNMSKFSDVGFSELRRVSSDALEFAKSLEIVPAEGKGNISPGARAILEEWHPAFLDSILASQRDGAIFLTDDLSLRILAEEAANIKGIWTQAIARTNLSQNKSGNPTLNDITYKLEVAGYNFLFISSQDILNELHSTGWKPNNVLSSLIRLLSNPNNHPASVTSVLAGVILHAWNEKPSRTDFSNLIRFLSTEFHKKHLPHESHSIFYAAYAFIHNFILHKNRRKNFRESLKSTTFYTDINSLYAQIDQLKIPLIHEIYNAIKAALQTEK